MQKREEKKMTRCKSVLARQVWFWLPFVYPDGNGKKANSDAFDYAICKIVDWEKLLKDKSGGQQQAGNYK